MIQRTTTLQLSVILLLFFASGASALMFETLWQRKMLLVFGASAPATAAVLMAFFIGSAIGSLLGSKLLKFIRNPLTCYALAELWIGVISLTVPVLISNLPGVLRVFGDSQAMTFQPYLIRLMLAVGIVLPATAGMGATIPIMNALVHTYLNDIGKSTALAYGINALGAVAGCLAGGFWLIEHVGVQNSLFVAALLNAVVVLSALLLWWRTKAPLQIKEIADDENPAVAANSQPATDSAFRWLPILYFGTGFLALGYEILWLRILSIYTATSTTTFALVLATYLFGFSLGSLWLFPLLARWFTGIRIFRISNAGVGACVLASMGCVYRFPAIREAISFPGGQKQALTWWRMTYVEIVLVMILVFIPTVLMGLAYPAVCKALIRNGSELGRKSGNYYFLGALASALGVGVTSLIVIPNLGLVGTLAAYCSASVIIAFVAHLKLEHQAISRLSVPGYLLLLAGAGAYGHWGVPFISDGILQPNGATWSYRPSGPTWHFSNTIFHSRVLSYEEGATAAVIVKQEQPKSDLTDIFRGLYIDDHHVASTRRNSVIDSKMLAHLPLMLHSRPRQALTVGFGSGGTSWSMCQHEVGTTAVEIEPAVIRTARFFFSQNGNVLENPHFSLVLNDARNHLLMTDVQYDVIATDVTNLQYRQNSSLYTVEYFELMKARLSADGVACAWIPMMSVTDESFAILLRSFQEVFPHASLWYMDYSPTWFAILIGTPEPLRFDMRRLREMEKDLEIQRDLEMIEINGSMNLPFFMYLDEVGYREFVGPGPLHTDNHPILEFSSAVSHYNFNLVDNFEQRLNSIRALRPRSYSPYVVNATPQEMAVMEQYDLAHRMWADLISMIMFDEVDHGQEKEFHKAIFEKTREVLEIVPDFMPALKLMSKFQ
jgi:spermidine synthase